jgi:hypothetical protein
MNEQKLFAAHVAEPQLSEYDRKRELFSPELTLGFLALKSQAEYATAHYTFTHDSISPQQHAALTTRMGVAQYDTQREFDKVKLQLMGYDGVKEDLLARYLNNIVPLDIIDSIKTHQLPGDKELSWREWFSGYASDDQLYRIVAEHNAVLLNHTQNDEIHHDIDSLLKGFLGGVDSLENEDRIGSEPKHPLLVAIHYGDIFDTFLRERAGYYDSHDEQIVLGQGHLYGKNGFVQEARNELPRVLTHEWVHGLLGKSLKDVTSPLASRWINEAITESISRNIRRHAGEVVVEDNTYRDERRLLAQLVRPFKSGDFISKMLFRAYTGTEDDREALVEIIDEAHGAKDVIEKVTQATIMEQTRIAKGGEVDRAVEVAAIQKVVQQFQTNPDAILLRGVDRLIDDLKAAATEPK